MTSSQPRSADRTAWRTVGLAAAAVTRVEDLAAKLVLAEGAYRLAVALRIELGAAAVMPRSCLDATTDPIASLRSGLADLRRTARYGRIAGDLLGAMPSSLAMVVSPQTPVPVPARPAELVVHDVGARRSVPIDPWRDEHDIALMLHNNLNGEYTTMELLAESSWEHPDLPIGVHERLLRQAADEARHVRLIEEELAARGHRYGDHGVFTTSYELCHSFTGVAAASRHELANRLLVRCSQQEALSLDDLRWQVECRRHIGHDRLADLFEDILGDEVHHVRNGHALALDLCSQLGLDPHVERALSHDRHVRAEQARHDAWLADNWQSLLLEEAPVSVDAPMRRFHNHRDRFEAGLGLDELLQDLCWEQPRRQMAA